MEDLWVWWGAWRGGGTGKAWRWQKGSPEVFWTPGLEDDHTQSLSSTRGPQEPPQPVPKKINTPHHPLLCGSLVCCFVHWLSLERCLCLERHEAPRISVDC